MFNVLIVDDEPIICGAISRFLLRSEYGIVRAETALNGFEALDYLRLDKFDLIITDIQMGGMNGIELMEVIFSEHPNIPIIVISAHEDFHYAQQALRLGAIDYLIKPVESEHLYQVVGNALSKRHSEDLRTWEHQIRQKYAVGQLLTAKSILLYEWLSDEDNEWTSDELEVVFSDLGVLLPGPFYCVLNVELDLGEGGLRRNTRFNVKDRKLLLFAALNIIEESLSSWEAVSFYGLKGQLVTIVSIKEAEWKQWGTEALTQIQLIARTMQANISTYLNLNSWIGLSRTTEGVTRIPALYLETKDALEAKQNDRPELPVYYIGDVEQQLDKLMLRWQQHLEGLVKVLQQQTEAEQAEAVVMRLLKELTKLGMPEEQWANCLLQAAYCLYGMLGELRDMLEEESLPPEPQAYARHAVSKEKIGEFGAYLTEIARCVIVGHVRRESSTVMKAMEYIRRSYANKGLKLQDVAREVHLSPNYFSYLFKRVTDKNLWDYLTEIRMKEAKRLLLQSDKKRYEISESIGYESPEHFSRVFKKHFGVSPADYRNR
ncbi:response regulator transcription factor [Cohnella herbarum]|uniref:Response regulator n=1 Tax=Cohnella herbarum TaxID=2728023 RepID=A0A7Z2ZPD3_9BACL|nr:response regulator [Cohnella herbarum]QJD86765.1 response regulator [Cohnella herbarum]